VGSQGISGRSLRQKPRAGKPWTSLAPRGSNGPSAGGRRRRGGIHGKKQRRCGRRHRYRNAALCTDAVKAAGGTAPSSIPGETLRFSIKRPGSWRDSKNTPFDGTAKISAVNPAQSRIDLETSLAGVFYLYIAGSFVALVILTAISPYIGAIPLVVGLLVCIYILVMAQGTWAQEMADRIAAGLTPSTHVAPQMPPSQPPPAAAAPPATATPSARVMEDLKKLGELHASGVLTDAEFEAKKAELLKRV